MNFNPNPPPTPFSDDVETVPGGWLLSACSVAAFALALAVLVWA